jgi:putative ATPase
MLEGGEDPRFIVRRMVILASEDIGNADPAALSVATAAAQAVEHVGLPEARYALAQAAIYLSLAPKSNAAGRALAAAERHVREHGAGAVPGWLRSGPLADLRSAGHERGGYDNPHRHRGHVSTQELLPEGVAGERFYEPDEAEQELAEALGRIRRARGLEER